MSAETLHRSPTAIVRGAFGSLPPLLRGGAVVLGIGLVLDLVLHSSGMSPGHAGDDADRFVFVLVHAVVLVGALVSIAGLFAQARSANARRTEGDRR